MNVAVINSGVVNSVLYTMTTECAVTFGTVKAPGGTSTESSLAVQGICLPTSCVPLQLTLYC